MKRLILVITCLTSFTLQANDDVEKESSRAEFMQSYQRAVELTKEQNFLEAARVTYETIQLGEAAGMSKEEAASLEFNYGVLLVQAKRFDIACDVLDRSVDTYKDLYGKKSPELISPLEEYARCVGRDYQKKSKAIGAYKRAAKLAKENYGKESEQHARVLLLMGQNMLSQMRDRRGNAHLLDALEIFEKVKGPDSSEAIATKFNLAKYAIATRRDDVAIQHLSDVLQRLDKPDNPESRLELTAHSFLVEVYERNGHSDLATQHCLAIGKMTPTREIQDYVPLFKPVPKYPRSALSALQEGSVVVEFSVDEAGFVQNPKVVHRDGSKVFDKPSLEVAKRFRYAPAFVDGKPVRTDGIQNRIVYAIND